MTEAEIESVRVYAASVFSCHRYSVHGPAHWKKVDDAACLIAPKAGANLVVARLFAALHDCCRWDDGEDLEHGPRAAALVRRLSGNLLQLDLELENTLIYAIKHHTDGETSPDPTIGACWDADRLDLGRVGIIPSPQFMSTAPGKEMARLGSTCLYRR